MNENTTTIRRGPIPLYVQLAGTLTRRLQAGYQPGDQFPTVEQLSAEYGVALVTVRQALGLLEQDGLLQRARGRGTTVLKTHSASGQFHLATKLQELIASTQDTRIQLLRSALEMPPAELLPKRGAAAPAYRFMHRVHAIDGRPYAVLRLYLDERLYQSLPASLFEQETVVCALNTLSPSPIRTGHQRLTIGRAAADDAAWLKVDVDSPVAQIRRYFYGQDETVIYLAEVIYRGDFVCWEMDLDV